MKARNLLDSNKHDNIMRWREVNYMYEIKLNGRKLHKTGSPDYARGYCDGFNLNSVRFEHKVGEALLYTNCAKPRQVTVLSCHQMLNSDGASIKYEVEQKNETRPDWPSNIFLASPWELSKL